MAQLLMGSEESISSQVGQSQMQICQYGCVHVVTAASTEAVSRRHSALSQAAQSLQVAGIMALLSVSGPQ